METQDKGSVWLVEARRRQRKHNKAKAVSYQATAGRPQPPVDRESTDLLSNLVLGEHQHVVSPHYRVTARLLPLDIIIIIIIIFIIIIIIIIFICSSVLFSGCRAALPVPRSFDAPRTWSVPPSEHFWRQRGCSF